jgi:hypothetical protein
MLNSVLNINFNFIHFEKGVVGALELAFNSGRAGDAKQPEREITFISEIIGRNYR